jgi:hypothetical protein
MDKTYIENNGIGYNANVVDVIKAILGDMVGEVFTFPAGTTLVEEVNVNGVILHVANGKVCSLGDYPLYEEINKIINPSYKLPDYLQNPNIISNFPNSNKNVGDTIAWSPPSHTHPEFKCGLEYSYHILKNDLGANGT